MPARATTAGTTVTITRCGYFDLPLTREAEGPERYTTETLSESAQKQGA